MQIADFQLHEPSSLEEACRLLRHYPDEARVLAGGTDLLVDLRQGRVTGVSHLVSLRKIPGLHSIEEAQGGLRIGTLVTPNRVAQDERIRQSFPALVDAALSMAAVQIRNLATVGGNLASAVPCSDLAPCLIAAGSQIVLTNGDSERGVPLEDFFRGPRATVRESGEIVTHVFLPSPRPRTGISYHKFMLRGGNAVAVASVAAMLRLRGDDRIANACLVLGAVAPIPLVARKAGEFLVGKRPSERAFAEAARIARQKSRPITDIRGSKEYRREIVEVLAGRALAQAAGRAGKAIE